MKIVSEDKSDDGSDVKELMTRVEKLCRDVSSDTVRSVPASASPMMMMTAINIQCYLHGLLDMMRAYNHEEQSDPSKIKDPDRKDLARVKRLCLPLVEKINKAIATGEATSGSGPSIIT